MFLVVGPSALAATFPDTEHIYVTGEGEVKVEPDIAEIDVTIGRLYDELRSAKSDVDTRTSDVVKLAIRLGVAKEDIRATQLHINPEYERDRDKRILQGYEVSRDITITLKDLTKYRELIQGLVDAGITEINDIAMSSTNIDALKAQALSKAIQVARKKAEVIAEQFNAEVSGVFSISEEPLKYSRQGDGLSYMLMAEKEEIEAFVPGSISIRSNIFAVFRLKVASQ